jgi:folliculin
MNAIIGLCHFCEFCGPSVIFTTQTFRETKISEIDFNSTTGAKVNKCLACKSIGERMGYMSKNSEGSSYFLSTQAPIAADVTSLVKQAAVRSLSCEVRVNSSDIRRWC